MSRRKFEIGNPKNAVDGVPLSDKAVLFWERYHKPMNAAAQSLNAALVNTQNILAGIVIEMEGYDPPFRRRQDADYSASAGERQWRGGLTRTSSTARSTKPR